MLAAERFRRLLSDLALSADDRANGLLAHRSVRATLQGHYYGYLTMQDHSRLMGAWAKGTEVLPARSIDLLFALPKAVREREWPERTDASVQWQMLDEIQTVLRVTHGTAKIRADGRAVTVVVDGQIVDVRPAFALQNGRYHLCDAHGAGRFCLSDPSLEEANLRHADHHSHGNARDLIRMVKCWQGYRSVPIPSFWLELLAIEFLSAWPRAGDPKSFYDWMVRDFFAFLAEQAGRTLTVPGSDEAMAIGSEWLGAARDARTHAAKACDFENGGLNADAWWEWEKIFGERIPLDS
jgi:hypothetical protein